MKKFLSVVLALTMIVSVFTTTVSAATIRNLFDGQGWSTPTYGDIALGVTVSAKKSGSSDAYSSATLSLSDASLGNGIGIDYKATLDMSPVRGAVNTLLAKPFITAALADTEAEAEFYAGTVTSDIMVKITYPAVAVVDDSALSSAGIDNVSYTENGARAFATEGENKTATIKYKNTNDSLTVNDLVNNPASIFDDINFTLANVIKYNSTGSHKVTVEMSGATTFTFSSGANAIVTYKNDPTTSFHIVSASIPSTNPGGGGGGGGVSAYTIKLDTNGGAKLDNLTIKAGTKAELPTPTRDGYVFAGWYLDSSFETAFDPDTVIKKSYTLYAKWEEITECRGIEEDNCPCLDFIDLDPTLWYHRGVDYVLNNAMMVGVEVDEFAPDEDVTRAMLVTVLWRKEGKPAADDASFTDLEDGLYYVDAVNWAAANDIVMGYSDTEFAPHDAITREQFAAIMYRYAKNKGYDVSVGENTNILSYTDYDEISEYAIPAMQYAVGSGLIQGRTASTLNPLDNTTRAEMATILYRFFTEIN